MKFRKKPVVIEAVQITDATFDAPHPNPEHIPGVIYDPRRRCVEIKTLEGCMRGDIGDWIIRGVGGELYPCKPDIFAATYEPVDDDIASAPVPCAYCGADTREPHKCYAGNVPAHREEP